MSPEEVALSYTPSRPGVPTAPGYMAGLSEPAWLFALVAYMGDRNPTTLDALAWRVRSELWALWPMVGRRPAGGAALDRYRAYNAHIVDRLARIAVAECISPAVAGTNKAAWRAGQLGVTERRWHQAYREPYERLMCVIDGWNHEFRRVVRRNQLIPSMEGHAALDNCASPRS